MPTIDLLRGTQTYAIDLARVPFLSRLGPNEGEMQIVCDPEGKIHDLRVSLFSSRRALFRELERIAQEADWEVPVEAIQQTTDSRFVVDLALRPEAQERLRNARIDMDDRTLETAIQELRPLLKDKHYTVMNIREVIPPQ